MPTTPTQIRSGLRSSDATASRTRRFVKCFPVEDRAFVGVVRGWLDEERESATEHAAGLERRLRRDYPEARLIIREVLAEAAGPADATSATEAIWFIFRDGSPTPAPLEFE